MDCDGDVDSTDVGIINGWFSDDPPVYDVRGDLDLDGDVDSNDATAATNNQSTGTMGHQRLVIG